MPIKREFKTVLTLEAVEVVKSNNIWIDMEQGIIVEQGGRICRLRKESTLPELPNIYIMTSKIPQGNGENLEINASITKEDYNLYLPALNKFYTKRRYFLGDYHIVDVYHTDNHPYFVLVEEETDQEDRRPLPKILQPYHLHDVYLGDPSFAATTLWNPYQAIPLYLALIKKYSKTNLGETNEITVDG
jgi:hypothetical protein